MKKFIIPAFISLVILGTACSERVEIDLNDEQNKRLVLYGYLTTDTMKHQISLTYSADYFFNAPPVPVQNAQVKIEEWNSDKSSMTRVIDLDPSGKNDGIYVTRQETYAIENHYYKLVASVQDSDIEGTYTAETFCPPISRTGLEIELELEEDWGKEGYIVVKCYYQDPPTREWYLFNIYKNGILVTDSLSEKSVSDDLFYNGGYTNGIGVGFLDQSRKDQKVYPGDTITFQAGSITEEYAKFIWEAQAEIQFNTPLFSGPPANISSNIDNGAIGFFSAFSTNYASTIYQ
ncbi:MAG: DUF4249 domain-containing protein [Bacteroidetes bacterium]|nr:DUF4249 domain-containing protein [Bacteroidota bacterium]